jgi:ADP-ribosyl-[dinitrogen reductase] hydrolase
MANHVLAGMMGSCVGDALGVPVEFIDRDTLMRNPVTGMRSYGTHHKPAGTWSDDTSMTLCLSESLTRGLDYRDIMDKFLEWFSEAAYTPHGEVFDVGNTTAEALTRFSRGIPPSKCGGITERDNGNGSLMRILPIVFYLRSVYGTDFCRTDEAFEIIHNVSALTHAHKRSQIACGIYVCVASMLIEGTDLRIAVETGIHKAVEYYRNHPAFSGEMHHYERLTREDFSELDETAIRSGGYVVDTLEAAIWCLLRTRSFKDCVLTAVNLGGDTDTVAAVAGGLSGLYHGYESIPCEWLSVIARRDYVESLCNRLHASSGRG